MSQSNQNYGRDYRNYLFLGLILLFLIASLIITVYYLRSTTYLSSSASYQASNSSVVSVSNSYVFASPVRAKAGGDLIRVTVFILDNQGLGMFDKKVVLSEMGNDTLDINEIQNLTDETGKAIFDVGSDKVGNYKLQVLVDGVQITDNLKIVFD